MEEEIDKAIELLQSHLEVNAGKLTRLAISEGIAPIEHPKARESFIILTHLDKIKQYLSTKE